MDAIIVGIVLAVLSPFIVFATNGILEHGRRKRAYERLASDPYVKVGQRIGELQCEGRDQPIMRNCEITAFRVGMLEVTQRRSPEEGDWVVTFTGREFEKLIPVYDLPQMKGARGRRKYGN